MAAAAGPANLELAPLESYGGSSDALAGVLGAGHLLSAWRCCEELRPLWPGAPRSRPVMGWWGRSWEEKGRN